MEKMNWKYMLRQELKYVYKHDIFIEFIGRYIIYIIQVMLFLTEDKTHSDLAFS